MSISAIPLQPACQRCHAPIDPTDKFCRHCGAATDGRADLTLKWWDSPWFILALLFAIAGPFAFPLLWQSRRFTRFWKVALTIIVTGITAYACWWTWVTVHQVMTRLQEALKV